MTDTTANYYNRVWSNTDGFQMSVDLAQAGYELLKNHRGKKCLDIGCGDGTNIKNLSQLGLKAEGCDIAQIAVDKALKNGVKAKVVDLNSPVLPYKTNSFDIIWFTEVVEHVTQPEQLMSEISRILKKNGLLFITTPNIAWWGNRIQLFLGKTLYDIHPQHIHWYNIARFSLLLKDFHFLSLQFISYRRLFPFPISLRLPILKKFDKIDTPHSLLSFSLGALAKNQKTK